MHRTLSQTLLLYGTVIFTCAALLFPIYWMFLTALAPASQLRTYPPSFWPDDPQWQVFGELLATKPMLLWLGNSALAAIAAASDDVSFE